MDRFIRDEIKDVLIREGISEEMAEELLNQEPPVGEVKVETITTEDPKECDKKECKEADDFKKALIGKVEDLAKMLKDKMETEVKETEKEAKEEAKEEKTEDKKEEKTEDKKEEKKEEKEEAPEIKVVKVEPTELRDMYKKIIGESIIDETKEDNERDEVALENIKTAKKQGIEADKKREDELKERVASHMSTGYNAMDLRHQASDLRKAGKYLEADRLEDKATQNYEKDVAEYDNGFLPAMHNVGHWVLDKLGLRKENMNKMGQDLPSYFRDKKLTLGQKRYLYDLQKNGLLYNKAGSTDSDVIKDNRYNNLEKLKVVRGELRKLVDSKHYVTKDIVKKINDLKVSSDDDPNYINAIKVLKDTIQAGGDEGKALGRIKKAINGLYGSLNRVSDKRSVPPTPAQEDDNDGGLEGGQQSTQTGGGKQSNNSSTTIESDEEKNNKSKESLTKIKVAREKIKDNIEEVRKELAGYLDSTSGALDFNNKDSKFKNDFHKAMESIMDKYGISVTDVTYALNQAGLVKDSVKANEFIKNMEADPNYKGRKLFTNTSSGNKSVEGINSEENFVIKDGNPFKGVKYENYKTAIPKLTEYFDNLNDSEKNKFIKEYLSSNMFEAREKKDTKAGTNKNGKSYEAKYWTQITPLIKEFEKHIGLDLSNVDETVREFLDGKTKNYTNEKIDEIINKYNNGDDSIKDIIRNTVLTSHAWQNRNTSTDTNKVKWETDGIHDMITRLIDGVGLGENNKTSEEDNSKDVASTKEEGTEEKQSDNKTPEEDNKVDGETPEEDNKEKKEEPFKIEKKDLDEIKTAQEFVDYIINNGIDPKKLTKEDARLIVDRIEDKSAEIKIPKDKELSKEYYDIASNIYDKAEIEDEEDTNDNKEKSEVEEKNTDNSDEFDKDALDFIKELAEKYSIQPKDIIDQAKKDGVYDLTSVFEQIKNHKGDYGLGGVKGNTILKNLYNKFHELKEEGKEEVPNESFINKCKKAFPNLEISESLLTRFINFIK